MPSNDESISVQHNPQNNRFEIQQDGLMAVLEYHQADAKIIFTHTAVPEALGGKGIGSRLVKAGLDYARANQLKVVPLCSFTYAYIQKHPEYQDLLVSL